MSQAPSRKGNHGAPVGLRMPVPFLLVKRLVCLSQKFLERSARFRGVASNTNAERELVLRVDRGQLGHVVLQTAGNGFRGLPKVFDDQRGKFVSAKTRGDIRIAEGVTKNF